MSGVEWGARRGWIFDLDGTLTVAAHDFDAIRAELGLPPGRPILEALGRLSAEEARPLRARLQAIEYELAGSASAAAGAQALLETLAKRRARVGVLTRNGRDTAWRTLRACGLARYFAQGDVLGRGDASPKPDPDGIHRLLERWRVAPAHAVMLGDYRFDLDAGRAAGVATVYVDVDASGTWHSRADLSVQRLDELLTRL